MPLKRTCDLNLNFVVLVILSTVVAAIGLIENNTSVVIGAMVIALALLPPAAIVGLLLGHGRVDLAIGAGLLLAVNVVCVNLASKVVILVKGIRPRIWWEKERADRAMIAYMIVWLVRLGILVFVNYGRRALTS